MSKPKAKTLQERFGFMDDDLKSPKHDEIMQWVDRNATQIINSLFYKDWREEKAKLEKLILDKIPTVILNRKDRIVERTVLLDRMQKAENTENKIEILKESVAKEEKKIRQLQEWNGFAEFPSKPKLKVVFKDWEHTITRTTENKYSSRTEIIGFVDMKIDYEDYTPILKSGFFKEEASDAYSLTKNSAHYWDFSGCFELGHISEKNLSMLKLNQKLNRWAS